MVLSTERGSQALEFALVLPLLALAAVVVLHAAVLAGDAVAAHAVAAQAARAAAIDGEAAGRKLVAELTGGRGELLLRPAGDDWLAAEVRLPTRAFGRFGRSVRLRAGAVARAW